MTMGLAMPLNGYAQENTSNDINANAIEEVIVTATKRETSLMETPVAVSSFSQADLDNQGIKNLLDIGDLVPNVQIGLSPTDSGVQVVVRGLTSNNFTEIGDPTVAMHFDGIYSPRPQAGLALMYDVERTEISRGPQGTLFGRNSTAGSINVISARPKFDEIAGHAEVEIGEFNQRTVKGWVNIPVNDVFGFRASALVDKADTWLNQTQDFFDLDWDTDGDGNTSGQFDVAADGIPNVDQRRNRAVDDSEAYGAVDRQAFRLSARYQPNEEIDWNVIYDYFEDNSPGSLSLKDCEKAEGTFFACDHDQWDVSVNIPGETDMTISSIRSILSWNLSDSLVFEHRVSFSQQERSQLSDGSIAYADPDHPAYGITRSFFDGASGQTIDFGNLVRNQALLDSLGYSDTALQPWGDLQLETEDSRYSSVVTEFQLKSQSDAKLQWIAGLFYLSEDNEIRFNVEDPFCCGGIRPLAQSFVQPERTVESTAAFVQFDYAATDRLNFTVGARYTHDEKQDKNGANYVTNGFNQPNVGLYDPDFLTGTQFDYLAYTFIGVNPTSSLNLYQANDLTLEDGTLGAGFLSRLQSTDNSHKGSWNQATWKLGFDYAINDDWFLYGYVATGFKSGGFGDSIDICDCNITDTFDYEPEENITYELGFKSTFQDGRLNVLGSFFLSQNKDLQQTFFAIVTSTGSEIQVPDDYNDIDGRTSTCSGGTGLCVNVDRDIGTLITANIAQARNMGIELEFDWRPWDGGRINGWVAWLDSEITDYDGATDDWFCLERALLGLTNCAEPDPNNLDDNGNAQRTASFDGNALPWSPEFSATVSAEHNWYLQEGLRLSPYVSVHWQDDIYFDNSNFDEGAFHSGQEAYASADVAMRLISEKSGWGLEAYVRNVSDERIRTWGDRGPGFLRSSFAKPRHYGIKFNKAF